MKVTIYKERGRKDINLVHEVLERVDDIAITYTDLSDNTFKSEIVKKVDVSAIYIRLEG